MERDWEKRAIFSFLPRPSKSHFLIVFNAIASFSQPLMPNVTKAAESLGVTRKTFSMLLNGKPGISPEMALRLSRVFGRTPEGWLRLQLQSDLWKAKQNIDIATHSETYLFTIMKK